MTNIINKNGETVATVRSDAEAARWFLDQGSDGDHLEDTGEALMLLVDLIFEDAVWHFNAVGNVVTTTHPE